MRVHFWHVPHDCHDSLVMEIMKREIINIVEHYKVQKLKVTDRYLAGKFNLPIPAIEELWNDYRHCFRSIL